MAFHLPEIADFFTQKDLSQIVDRAKNDALKGATDKEKKKKPKSKKCLLITCMYGMYINRYITLRIRMIVLWTFLAFNDK